MSPPTTTTHGGATSATSISDIHPDIIQSHILTKLDGASLSSAASSSPLLHLLCTETKLWSDLCTATWPSTSHPRVQAAITTFPGGHRSYFSDSFPTLDHHLHRPSKRTPTPPPPTPELISAVDLHYKNKLIFSKVEVTETASNWFVNSPFRVDLLDPKETVPTEIILDGDETTCLSCVEKYLTLSWVVIDPTQKRSVNLSSLRPVSVKRHWLTGQVQVMYNTILSRDHQCNVEVILGGNKEQGGVLSVWEVSISVEDVEGKNLNGRGSLVILQEALRGGGRRKMGVGEERARYEEYLEMKREKEEREKRREKILDIVCIASGIAIFVTFWAYILLR
ncbi:hypothetical protein LguiA_021370 [Lonicera macranthoides]